MRLLISVAVFCLIGGVGSIWAHPGHDEQNSTHPEHDSTTIKSSSDHLRDEGALTFAQSADSERVTGNGKLKFRVLYTSEHLPTLARSVLVKAHGGFAVDRREGRGEIYFALPGVGIIQISSDFSVIRVLDSPAEILDNNMHNTTIWFDKEDNGFLAFPANEARKVFTTTLDGRLTHTLEAPTAPFTFTSDRANNYFSKDGELVPTDVEYMEGRYYITTGYSRLDHVLTADVTVSPSDRNIDAGLTQGQLGRLSRATPRVSATWNDLAFGGKGAGDGLFGIGHGISRSDNGMGLVVADRPSGELELFSPEGEHIDTMKFPEGTWPCDVDYASGYAVVGCLHGPDREKGAPIYLLRGTRVMSIIMPKYHLGLANFRSIHNATLVERNGKLYIIALAWNPGDFAILEQVTD